MKIPEFLQLPDFVETNRPRHQQMEAVARLADPHDRFDAADYVAEVMPQLGEAPARPESLLEMYDGVRAVAQDAQTRPKHYTDRQHEIIRALTTGRKIEPVPTVAEKNELMLTFTRSTEAEARRKDVVSRASQKLGVTEDGTPIEDLLDGPSFQNQKYDDEIVII